MSTKIAGAEKGSADGRSDVDLIDAATIRRLADEQTDAHGCRFAAVARRFDTEGVPGMPIELPVTRVAYVDASGEYAIERQYIGHREDWQDITRTAVITDESVVSKLPARHRERYAPILETHHRVHGDE